MPTTMELLDRALNVKRQTAWARELNLTDSAFTNARKRGRLSPVLAGTLAEQLHEDAAQWMAIAALEAEQDSHLKDKLLASMSSWRKRLLSHLHALTRATRAARKPVTTSPSASKQTQRPQAKLA